MITILSILLEIVDALGNLAAATNVGAYEVKSEA